MKKGFTIIELLVASLLLGMLVTILTMVFNQSSIAWRAGTAGERNLRATREEIAELRDEADNAFVWHNNVYRHVGLWNRYGDLRDRSYVGQGKGDSNEEKEMQRLPKTESALLDFEPVAVNGDDGDEPAGTYTVNVKSAGPDKMFNTYDDIWSWPDDFE